VRHRAAPYIAGALVFAAPAQADTVTIRQARAPELTLTVPAGWRVSEARHHAVAVRGDRRLVLRQCPLARGERDMTGRRAARARPNPEIVAVPVRGGTCLVVAGSGAPAFGRRVHAFLGRPGPVPASDAAAERLAREARRRTLAMARVQGTAAATLGGRRIEGTFAWDLPAGYRHQAFRYGTILGEVVRDRTGDYVRDEFPCWGATSPAAQDDALEPRLELQEWNAPPATATAWRVAYAPAEPQPDGSTLVRWTGFVADGEAVIAPDGRLARVLVEDHGQAVGRTAWRTVEIGFTGFPAAITPVRTEPRC
jgi:hypothetical protein